MSQPPSKRPKRNGSTLNLARTFNTDSPITKSGTDVQSFLSICLLNWAQYTEDEKEKIISTLPPSYQIRKHDNDGKLTCPVSPEFISSDRVVGDQIAKFKRDVTEGYYTKTWQEKAQKATEERAKGKFNHFLNTHAAESFMDDEDAERIEQEAAAASSDGEFKQKGKGKKAGQRKGREKEKDVRKSARRTKMTRASSTMMDVLDPENDTMNEGS